MSVLFKSFDCARWLFGIGACRLGCEVHDQRIPGGNEFFGCIGCRELENGELPICSWDTGKIFHNLIPPYMNYDFTEKFRKVEVVDGLLLATQTDIPWREDIFTGWDFYDCSQAKEMQRMGKKVVIPFQKMPWCYHDSKPCSRQSYYRDYGLFIQEYYKDAEEEMYPNMGAKILEMEKILTQAKACLDVLLDEGKRGF